MPRRRGSRLVRRLLLLQLVTVLVTVGGLAALGFWGARRDADDAAAALTLATASAVAVDPTVAAALQRPDPAATLQPLAREVQLRTGTAYVVVMSVDGVRYSHADPARIGEHYIGTIAPAAAGGTVSETYTGTLGPSMRSVVPVRGADGHVAGLVAVGQLSERVGDQALRQLPAIAGATAGALALGGLLAWLLARRLRRQTLGLEPEEIAAAYAHHDAVLHAVGEGLLVVDGRGRVVVVNDEARSLLGLPAGTLAGRDVDELGVDPALRELIGQPGEVRDALALAGERVLLVSSTAVDAGTRVVTLRDRTELASALRERDDARGRADAMAGQAHEFANRMQTVLTLVQLGSVPEALRAGSDAVRGARGPAEGLTAVGDPVLAAVLADKAWAAGERGVTLEVSDAGTEPAGWDPGDLVTVLGNLLDNALDAVDTAAGIDERRRVVVTLADGPGERRITVRDTGPGLPAGADVFRRGWSTKHPEPGRPRGIGLALVARVVDRLGGTVTVAAADPGTRFTVTLPYPPVSASRPSPPRPPSGPATSPPPGGPA